MDADEAQKLWIQYKTERREAYKKTGLTALKRLREKMGDQRFANAVLFSIACNYRGIWEQKEPPAGAKSIHDLENT